MRRFPPSTWALGLAGIAWVATLAEVVRSEVLLRQESSDVRALVDSARLTRTHASATYAIRVGAAIVGSLTSTVSGGQHEEQLAYVLDGRLTTPQEVHLKGVVLAGWDRRPERLVLEATIAGERHRLEGTLRPDAATGGHLFELRYVPPSGGAPREATWVLPEAPVLAPGPLPIPEFLEGTSATGEPPAALAAGSSGNIDAREGALPDPMTGAPMDWHVTSGPLESMMVAGRVRKARRHDVKVGAWDARAWTELTGFPLRLELPGGIVVELVAETR